MKTFRLCKIEGYRFIHSLEITKYFVIIPIVLVLMCYVNIYTVRISVSNVAIWSSISSAYLYILLSFIILIAIYVGREYRYKTINYEVVREYGICRIAIAKTITCGLIVPLVYTMCILFYLFLLVDNFTLTYVWRIILLCVVHMHICTATIMYVMLCKNGIWGGVVGFLRFFVIEIVLQSFLVDDKIIMIKFIYKMMAFQQWSDMIRIDLPINAYYGWMIILTMMAECVILLELLRLNKKKYDFV